MSRPAALALAAVAVMQWGPASARSCRVAPEPAHDVVAQRLWRDTAEFSFLVGRDAVDDGGSMTLARGLRGMGDFAALRGAAAQWGTLRASSDALGDTLGALGSVVDGLQQLCDQLDATALDPGVPLDEAGWRAAIARLEAQLDAAIAAATPVVPQLERYAVLLRAAAAQQARTPQPSNPLIRVGPTPAVLAADFGAASGRWRALFSDLQNARRILPIAPQRGTAKPLIAITAAMRELARIAGEARALAGQRLSEADFRRFDSGDYLYDQCPMIKDGSSVQLENPYWSGKSGARSLFGGFGFIFPPGPTLKPGSGVVAARPGILRWQFIRTGNGYWLIRNAAFGATPMALDVESVSGASHYKLRMSSSQARSASYSGQQWRCAASSRPDQIHLYNRFLSEAMALDAANDQGVAIMLPTGNYAGQYWRVIEN